jgi:hypothetical protein
MIDQMPWPVVADFLEERGHPRCLVLAADCLGMDVLEGRVLMRLAWRTGESMTLPLAGYERHAGTDRFLLTIPPDVPAVYECPQLTWVQYDRIWMPLVPPMPPEFSRKQGTTEDMR